MSEQQKCESCEALRKALRECAERLVRCAVIGGTDADFAEESVAGYRSLLEQTGGPDA